MIYLMAINIEKMGPKWPFFGPQNPSLLYGKSSPQIGLKTGLKTGAKTDLKWP